MRAVVFHGVGDIRLEDVPEPSLKAPGDAIVRITRSAICGTDLHFVRGTFSGMKPGTVLGHEAVGIVEEVGPGVRNFEEGDRVVVPSTIACGNSRGAPHAGGAAGLGAGGLPAVRSAGPGVAQGRAPPDALKSL